MRHRFTTPLPLTLNVVIRNKKIVHSSFSTSLNKTFVLTLETDHPSQNLEKSMTRWLESYLKRQQPTEKLPLDLESLPPFTRQVLNHLQKIPFGQSESYSEIARLLNNPRGARAVGNACGKNPLPLFIPCHRVLKNDALLGGFSCGLPIKRLLLAHENVDFRE